MLRLLLGLGSLLLNLGASSPYEASHELRSQAMIELGVPKRSCLDSDSRKSSANRRNEDPYTPRDTNSFSLEVPYGKTEDCCSFLCTPPLIWHRPTVRYLTLPSLTGLHYLPSKCFRPSMVA